MLHQDTDIKLTWQKLLAVIIATISLYVCL